MFCTKCGAMVDISHNFCSKCGTPVKNPLPDIPHAPPVSVSLDSDEFGDEDVVYRQGTAHYLKKASAWVPGVFVIARIYTAFYTRSYGTPIRIMMSDIDAVSDAYVRSRHVCFSVRTKDGRIETFSVDAFETEETQSVVDRLRRGAGVQKSFIP